MICRVVLGLIFFVFGLNGLHPFLPMPTLPPKAMQFMLAMIDTGYLMFLLKIIEVACGALLLSSLYVPFALVLLGPIVVNIFLFHAMLAPEGMVIAIVVLGLWGTLLYCYRGYYRSVFTMKANPANC